MSTVYDTAGLVGLLVPWSVLDESKRSVALSSLVSLSTIPAMPTADQVSEGQAVVTGTWATPPAGAEYDLRIQTGGNVGPAAATWAWKGNTEADTSYRGQDWPTRARRMWMSLARANDTAGRSDMVTLPSGRVCIVQAVRQAGTTPEIRAGYLEQEVLVGGAAGDEIVVVTEDTAHAAYQGWVLAPAGAGHASIEYWEEEDLVLIVCRYESGGTGSTEPVGQIAVFQSADQGATYSLRKAAALEDGWRVGAGGTTVQHTAYGNILFRRVGGSWSLIGDYRGASAPNEAATEQWAGTSPDHLALVERTTITSGSAGDGFLDIHGAGDGDGLLVVGVGYDITAPAAEDVYALRLGSAWQPLSETEQVRITTPSGAAHAGRYPCAAADPDGTLWVAYLDSSLNVVRLTCSTNHGASWKKVGYFPLELATNANLQYLSLTRYRGGLVLSFAADNGANYFATAQLRSYVVALGGWDNVPLPAVPTPDGAVGRLGFGVRYTAFTWGVDTPDTLSWFPPVNPTTTNPAGAITGAAPALAVPDGAEPYLTYTDAGAGSYVTWTLTATNYDQTGIIVETDATISVIGASVIANNEILRVTLADAAGANMVDVSIRGDANNFELYDHTAAAAKTTVALAATTRREFRLAIRDATGGVRCALYYRIPGEQVWTQYVATIGTMGGATRTVRQGAVTTNGQAMRFYRTEFVGTIGPAGPRDITRALAVANLLGRPTSPRPMPMQQGLAVSWRRGPLHPGHTWSLKSTAKYPPALVGARDYPSPSDRWRSTADSVVADWVWEPDGGKLWSLPGPLVGMLLLADGVETVTLAGRDSAGAYQTLLTATPSAGLSGLRYSAVAGGGVTGGALRPDATGNTANRPFREGELVGGWVRITTSGASYRITGNTSGLHGPSASLKPTIYVSGWSTAEPATGEFTIFPPVSFHCSAELSPVTGYDRLRLRIAAAAGTVAGRYEIKAIIGSVYVPGRRYSYGRTPSLEPVTRGVETAGGRVFYDPNQPLRRVERFAWQDAYGTRDLHGYTTTAGPDALLLASGGTWPLSFLTGVHKDMMGILELLSGPARTMVYLPRVEPQLTAWSSSDPDRWRYGRITSALSTPRPWGDEAVREEVTISEIVVSEEL